MRALAFAIRNVRDHFRIAAVSVLVAYGLVGFARAQTDCADGNGVLANVPLKGMTTQELIKKFASQESKVKEARSHYTYTQDVLIQTLNGTAVDASSTKSPKSRTTTRASGSRLSVFPRCPHYGMCRSRQMTWTTFVYSCLGY